MPRSKLGFMRYLKFLVLLSLFSVGGCASLRQRSVPMDKAPLTVRKASFSDLPGWQQDDQYAAAVALQKSCSVIMKQNPGKEMITGGLAGTFADWHSVCQDAENLPVGDEQSARRFFQTRFTPYQIIAGEHRQGLFTGYYEALLHGSRTRHAPYLIPIYGRPSDLVAVHLGDFKPDLKGETIFGHVKDGNLKPYFSRKQIENGAMQDKAPEIVWVDNAVDAFFLHIQGSGRILMDDGTVLRVGYAAQNGQPYTAIGHDLVARGDIPKKDISMQSIRAWLESHPDQAPQVMDLNESYVFFRVLDAGKDEGPMGAEGVPLTPGRSLAVDHRKLPYGVPVYIDAQDPRPEAQAVSQALAAGQPLHEDKKSDKEKEDDGPRLDRLMIAQDTGGAIRGPIRGDVFWGSGHEAAAIAGVMKSKGRA